MAQPHRSRLALAARQVAGLASMDDYQPFKFTAGGYQCAVMNDGGYVGNAGFFFTNAPAEELDQALQDHGLTPDNLPTSWNCLYIDTGDTKLLFDTGWGPREGLPEGKLIESLREMGVMPEQIDLVLLSHAHPDHIGGCTDAAGRLLYPHARFMIAQAEWDFWTNERNLAGQMEHFSHFARKNLPPLKGRLRFIDDEREILPGISIVSAPGHTPGHFVLRIDQKDKAFYIMADTILHPLQLQYPAWTAGVDLDSEQAVATRLHLLEKVAREQALLLFHHFDFPALGRVIKDGDKWLWQPLASVA